MKILSTTLLALLALSLIATPCGAAIDAGTVWEMRASGSTSNGGGFFNRDPGTSVDYSQQDAGALTAGDGTTSGIGVTTFTSVTGGFTGAMAGNVTRLISGNNLVPGWYEITSVSDGNTVFLDRAPDDGVGGVDTVSFTVGGAFDLGAAATDDEFFEQLIPGNVDRKSVV